MFVSFWALNPDGTYAAPLPDFASWTLSPVVHSPGAVELEYPANGRNFELLRANVTQDRDLEVAIWVDGKDANSRRAILNTSDGDDVAESAVWRFGGNLLPVRLEEAVVWPRTTVVQPPTGPAPTTDLAAFRVYAATAGRIMATLMQEAQGRGALTDIVWDFNNTVDSFGTTWSKTITLKIAPGTTLLKVAQTLAEAQMAEFDVVWSNGARRLVMWEYGTRSVDRTLGADPLIFRAGRDIIDAPRKHTVRPAGTALLAIGGEGIYRDQEDATARARRGRRIERAASQGSITDPSTLLAYAQAQLPAVTAGAMEAGHGLAIAPAGRRPLVDYDIPDWVWSDTGHGLERLKLKQLTVSGDQDGLVSAGASLNDLIADALEALARRVEGIEGGTTVTGTSSATPGEQAEDTMPPAAPTGLVAESIAYQDDEHTQTLAAVTVSWGEVITNADGTAADDVAGYKVRYAYLGLSQVGGLPSSNPEDTLLNYVEATPSTGVPDTTYTFAGVEAGANIGIQVAAFDQSGNQSAWSAPLGHDTAIDNTPPPVPSTPVVTNYLGQLRVAWDGLGSAGEEMPRDLAHVEVHVDVTNNFTPTAATLVDSFSTIAGERVITDLPYDVEQFVRLIAVDRTGNASAPSAVGSAIPAAIGYADIAFSQVGNLVEDGSFETLGGRELHGGRSDAAWSFVEGGPTGANHGDWYARGNAAVGSGIRPLWLSGLLPAVADQQFVFRLAIRRAAANGDLLVRIRFHLANGTTSDLQVTYTTAETADTWLIKTPSYYTAPAGTVAIELSVALAANCTAGAWWVDRVEAREAIGTLLVQNAAITDAKVSTLSVGKLTAGTLSVAVTNAGIIRSGTSGQRYELDAASLRFYNAAGTQTVGIDGVTNFITGTLQSGLSGERWQMHPDGTLRLYPASGVNYSQIANLGNDVVWRGPLDANQRSGRLNVNALGVGLNFSAESEIPSNLRAEVAVFDRRVMLTSPYFQFTLNGKLSTTDGSVRRIGFIQSNSSGAEIASTRVEYKVDGNSNPGFVAIGEDAGWKSEDAFMLVVSADMNQFRTIKATSFVQGSSAQLKEDIADVRALLDPLAVIREARARKFRYRDDDPDTVPPRVGVLAEELPDVLVTDAPDAAGGPTASIDLGSQIGVLWGAIGQILDQEIRSVAGRTSVPNGPMLAGREVELPIEWDETPLEVPTGGIVTVQSAIAWLGRVTARIKPGSITADGCTVVVRALAAVSPNSGSPITVEAQALYVWVPPYEEP